jgi:hypothetical protein
MAMRHAVGLAIVLSAVPLYASGQTEIVKGFHGYAWGTRVSDIPEIAGTEVVAQRDGLIIHSAEITYEGRTTLAGFYFHPDTGGLVEGSYIFPLSLEECESEWARLADAVETAHPGLERSEQIPRRAGDDRQTYDSDCEYFVYNAHREVWSASFTNPDPPGDRVLLWMKEIGRTVRMTIVYRGGVAQAWVESVKVRRFGRPHAPLAHSVRRAAWPRSAGQRALPGSS